MKRKPPKRKRNAPRLRDSCIIREVLTLGIFKLRSLLCQGVVPHGEILETINFAGLEVSAIVRLFVATGLVLCSMDTVLPRNALELEGEDRGYDKRTKE